MKTPWEKNCMVTSPKPRQPLFKELRQQIESFPPLKTEESIVLRILVQALVIVGIVATDVAAGTGMGFWAVPLSVAGAFWSWRCRKGRNITLKFILAIAMIAVLFYFLGNLVRNLNDTRLVLAELLVQLQVLHSFDLPRRKDLGYSMVIGLILLGVAGTVSQTLSFAPFVLLFLAIALPTLVLDYRSRLGLEPTNPSWGKKRSKKSSRQQYSPLALGKMGAFLGITLVLGLLIFALMPRFQGYQLQTFPVNSPVELGDKVFDEENRGISNPGYVSGGRQGGAGGGGAPEEGEGVVDDSFYYGFNNKINQNLRGEMTPKVVLRIRSQAPGFWRVMAFDRYTGQGWEISREDQLMDLYRPGWSYRFSVTSPYNSYFGSKTKQVIQTYSAASELPNIIPALSQPRFLFFPTRQVAIDPEGGLRSPVSLVEGLTYTVISDVPYRDRTLLGKAQENYPQHIQKYYLNLPPAIRERVKQEAEELLAKSSQPLTSAYEKALFLAQALKQNYTIQPDLPFFGENDDLVEKFLFKYQGGYPDHFSTVYTIMLRSLGIPARLAVGFAPGQFNPFTGYYLVKNTDAYALTEVYFSDYGWFTFDPIPGHEIIPPSFEDDQTFSVLKQLWNWVAGWLPSPITAFISELWTRIIGFFFKIIGWFWGLISNSLIGFLIGLTIIISLGLIIWLLWNYLLNVSFKLHLKRLSPIERIYVQMLKKLQEKGYPKHLAQTPLEYAKHFPEYPMVESISTAYIRWRYGDKVADINSLEKQLKLLFKILKSKV
jgi:transglutaminase-like putative cysteine protease